MAVESKVHLHSKTAREPQRGHNKRRRNEVSDVEDDACADLYAAAQLQLQQEMIAAGMEGSLPLSFGGGKQKQSSRKRKRQRTPTSGEASEPLNNGVVDAHTAKDHEEESGEASSAIHEEHEKRGEIDAPAEAVGTSVVEKVRVRFDSDGEVSERVVENVEMAVELVSKERGPHQNSSDNVKKTPLKKKQKQKDECPVPIDVHKFWSQRKTLFYKFEDGIQLDHESWYSVTPQAIAEHIAQRLRCDVVVDPFAGCGGNVIQLALTCKQVIAIDIDPEKVRMARHNAAIYGVAHKIEWIVGNSMELLPSLKADAVFLSPPWGGQNYSRKCFSLDDMVVNGVSGVELFAKARQVTPNIAYYLPKTTPTKDLEALAPGETVECEKIFLNKQLKVVTAYYGSLTVEAEQETQGEPTETAGGKAT